MRQGLCLVYLERGTATMVLATCLECFCRTCHISLVLRLWLRRTLVSRIQLMLRLVEDKVPARLSLLRSFTRGCCQNFTGSPDLFCDRRQVLARKHSLNGKYYFLCCSVIYSSV